MAFDWRPVRQRLLVNLACCAALLGAAADARAFDFFGLFGSESEEPLPVGPATLPYSLAFAGADKDDLETALKDVSVLWRLRREPPPDGDTLVRRAEADLPRLIDALWGRGYYAARVVIEIAGQPIAIEGSRQTAAAAAATRLRNRQAVPVRIVVEPGPLYHFAPITVVDEKTGLPFPPEILPPKTYDKVAGEPARTATLVAAASRIADHFRRQGHPFVRIGDPEPVVDHRTRLIGVRLAVAPGPTALIGAIGITGAEGIDKRVVSSFIYVEPGTPYSPEKLQAIRKSVGRIEAVGSVRVREAEKLDPDGTLPLAVDVTERPRHVLGGALRYSTVDGPAVKAYWADRNLFGGAERLRIDADLYYTTAGQQFRPSNGFDWSDLGGRFAVGFIKPALWGTRNDFVVDAQALRERTDTYTSRLANGVAAIRHRLADTFWVQGGIEYEIGQSSSATGQLSYSLLGLPFSMLYDNTDNELDPTRGVRISATLAPYLGFDGAPPTLFVAKAQGSIYLAVDEDARTVLAARAAIGSISGGPLNQIPANRRFYAGGGGSVRGYEYKSIGPTDAFGLVTGGRSLLEGSLEARIRITETIGIVPFVDAGAAFDDSIPDFDQRIRVGVGLGLRYYTAIGPIRVDVATPLDRNQPGTRPVALYIGIGQAF